MTESTRQPCVIVAEIGANHNQSFDRAAELLRAAAWAGANAVKIQLFTPEQMTLDSEDEAFTIPDGPWAGRTLWDLYERAAMPTEWVPELMAMAKALGLGLIASLYHPDMVPVAEGFQIPVYKVSSFEIAYDDLHRALCDTGRPVILSTGCATLEEIDQALAHYGHEQAMLLKCCSQYPAPLDQMHLATILDLKERFKVPVGLSDHTTGIVCSVVAVSFGAQMIEKHLNLDDGEGLDASFSLEPKRFKALVETVRAAEAAIGTVDYTPTTKRYKRKCVEGQWVRTVF